MAQTRKEKEASVAQLKDLFSRQRSVVFMTLSHITVKDMTALRKKLREENVTYLVPKKTLLKRALQDTPLSGFPQENLTASFAMAASDEDEITPAKLLAAFLKDHEQVQFLGGIVNHAFLTGSEVKALAKLPTKQELLGQVVGTIAAPMTGLLGVFQGTLRQFVGVLSAYQEKKVTS